MALARHQFSVTDDAGNVLPGASIEVRREDAGAPLAALYSDRAGTVALGNPFLADSEGFAALHIIGGAYRLTVTKGGYSRTLRYVAIGRASETDIQFVNPAGAWSSIGNYSIGDYVTYSGRPLSAGSPAISTTCRRPRPPTTPIGCSPLPARPAPTVQRLRKSWRRSACRPSRSALQIHPAQRPRMRSG
jgi:hypothetical protein